MKEYTFREWTDPDFTFNQQTKLAFAQCDRNSNMTWGELLRFTSDGAGEAFTVRDMSWKFMLDKGYIFVVSRVSFHINKMPVASQEITLQTWEEAPQGPLFVRRYQIIDTQTKEILLTGFTLWTLIDFNTRKIIPGKNFTLRECPTKVTNYEGIKAGKISTPENLELIGNHKIVFSDIDANGHVNNSKYINFVIDCLPEEYQNKIYKDMRLNYSKEATFGDTVDLYASINPETKMLTVIGKVGDAVCFETELYW